MQTQLITAEDVIRFASDPRNTEAFAEVLAKVLPVYAQWKWGENSPYKRWFRAWQAAGVTVYPNHFYSPVPDLSALPEERIRREANVQGIDFRETSQLELLRQFHKQFQREYALFAAESRNEQNRFFFGNGAFESVDAEVLYCMIRHLKPRRVVEIGGGFSTLISAAACERNTTEGFPVNFTVIEPFPSDIFAQRIPGLTALIREKVENVSTTMFSELEVGDILFIDSSHVLRVGNDVEYEYFELIPRTRTGVLIHIHDIFLPFRYPASWISHECVFWNEQYLVEAMLRFGSQFEVVWAGCYMHLKHPQHLAAAFPSYRPDRCLPGSLWLRRTTTPGPEI